MMKKTIIVFIVILIPCFASHAQQNALEELKNTLTNWVNGFNTGDYQKAISIYSEDFIGCYPDQHDQTLKDIKEQYQHLFNNRNLTVKISFKADEIKADGNFAYVRMTMTASIKPTYAPQPAIATDKGLQIWYKQNNGEWKLVRSSTFPLGENTENLSEKKQQ
jgi:ketosteroid isomerase-like protein